jgi:hypothetical protein
MLPSPKMGISIRTPDTRCLISTCKIPANSLYNLLSYGDLPPEGSRTPPRSVADTSSINDMDSPDVWAARKPRKYLATLYKPMYTARMSTIRKTLKLSFLRLNRAEAERFTYLQGLNTALVNNILYTKARDVS